jgi:uncharacterized protein YndB with AHSA1/START domain
MSTTTAIPPDEPLIVMTRVYDAPRELVWETMTRPEHVRQWWGGPGFTNPVCEMDVRAGGRWHHVMRFPDGTELTMEFVFVEVAPPTRLVWQDVEHGKGKGERPAPQFTATLDTVGTTTRFTLVARFDSMAHRQAAVAMGFTRPIEASHDRLAHYLTSV